eukprot:scaffold3892_cov331-Prasinococcus_capsulatus_cf.AAC.4
MRSRCAAATCPPCASASPPPWAPSCSCRVRAVRGRLHPRAVPCCVCVRARARLARVGPGLTAGGRGPPRHCRHQGQALLDAERAHHDPPAAGRRERPGGGHRDPGQGDHVPQGRVGAPRAERSVGGRGLPRCVLTGRAPPVLRRRPT